MFVTKFSAEYLCPITGSLVPKTEKRTGSLLNGYDANIMGMVMEGILLIYKDKKITYTLSEEADKLYEKIIDKLNDQFNLKYTSASQLSASQPDLNNNEKSELSVRTKGTEIIGRLTCSLWIYCNGKPLSP